ncbi:hypothetical protein KQH56_01780 [bacterium]|nr:hypothetical protein [bacterium]
MRLTPPKKWTWYVSLVLGLVAIIGMIVTIPFVSANAVWFALAGWLLMILATALTGL